MIPASRPQPYTGPVLLSYGFRPFFLLGALWAALEVLAWLPMFYGEVSLGTAFSPVDWHVHEMLFGYVPAIVAGFLLTAIPTWTGRPPLQGGALLGLVVVWLAGRAAVLVSADIGWRAAALIDVAFLAAMAAVAAREIVAAKNWRNLKVVALLGLLAAANLGFHFEAHIAGQADYATRGAVAIVLLLIMAIAGRLIPNFTRNWLMQRPPGRLPAPFGRFDAACMIVSVAGLAFWVVEPAGVPAGWALLAAAVFNVVRLARWAGERTITDRLVLVLHAGFAFVPLGFLLAALTAFGMAPPSAGIHAWTVGAIGVMTLAIMSRVSLGHTGRPLSASPALQGLYAIAVVAAVARVCAALEPAHSTILLHVAACAWAVAFLGFAALYAPLLSRPARAAPVRAA